MNDISFSAILIVSLWLQCTEEERKISKRATFLSGLINYVMISMTPRYATQTSKVCL